MGGIDEILELSESAKGGIETIVSARDVAHQLLGEPGRFRDRRPDGFKKCSRLAYDRDVGNGGSSVGKESSDVAEDVAAFVVPDASFLLAIARSRALCWRITRETGSVRSKPASLFESSSETSLFWRAATRALKRV